MFVSNHIGVACEAELTGLRVVYLGAGEDIVIAGCASNKEDLSIGKESGCMTKASVVQAYYWGKCFCGGIIEFGSELWGVPGGVSAGDQHLTVLQQSGCQPLPRSHQAPCILK